MNNGKICVSVCAKTAAEMAKQIRKAEEFGDIIELRFDCLDPSGLLPRSLQFESAKPLLLTYRPANQGGHADDDLAQRVLFWKELIGNPSIDRASAWFDLEADLISELDIPASNKIVSIHDFSGTPDEIDAIFDGLGNNGEIVKIAVQTGDITDCIPVWKLIERARSQNKKVIPIAMREAGKWTRILGLAHGAFMTYASLESGSETAPGQISAKDLIETYRVKELDENTRVFGIIGDPVSQSLSLYMHNSAFASRRINAVFIPFLVRDLDGFIRRMIRPETSEVGLDFGGLSVTMPHKQAIMKHLDEIDETARLIGAVNTVKIDGGKLIGYNTDAHGFITPLKQAFGDLSDARVAVFGAGGAARACVFALQQEGANVTLFARNRQKAGVLADEFKINVRELTTDHKPLTTDFSAFDIVVNATPFGMKGELEDKTLFTADELAGVKFVYDLVTMPADTPIIREAKKTGNPAIGGLEMLVAQGAEQFRIWTGENAPADEMKAALTSGLK